MDAEEAAYLDSLIPTWQPREYANHWRAERDGEKDERLFKSYSACAMWCRALNREG